MEKCSLFKSTWSDAIGILAAVQRLKCTLIREDGEFLTKQIMWEVEREPDES